MKKIIFLFAIVVIVITMLGCDFVPNTSGNITSGSILVGGTGLVKSRAGSLPDNEASIDKVWIRAFKTTGELIPALGVTGTDGAAILTWDDVSKYTGSITLDLTGLSGKFFIHAMAYNDVGEIVFQGNSAEILAFGSSPLPITTGPDYTVGDRGPGGGWIFYDKGTYTEEGDANGNGISEEELSLFGDDEKMGKSWRYLEAAADDFSLAWLDAIEIDDPNARGKITVPRDRDKINTNTHKIHNKKVKQKNDAIPDDELVVELSEYDWYWGPAETHYTLPNIEEGWLNTDKIDELAAVTPNLKTARGRKAHAAVTTNTRRDLSKTLRDVNTGTINNYSDWFVPSKTELLRIFTHIALGHTDRNFADDTNYWSSSENTGTTAYAIDFSDNPGAEITQDRSEAYRVRPARAF